MWIESTDVKTVKITLMEPCCDLCTDLPGLDPTNCIVTLVFKPTEQIEDHLRKIYPNKVFERKSKSSGRIHSNLISTPLKSTVPLPSLCFLSPPELEDNDVTTEDEGEGGGDSLPCAQQPTVTSSQLTSDSSSEGSSSSQAAGGSSLPTGITTMGKTSRFEGQLMVQAVTLKNTADRPANNISLPVSEASAELPTPGKWSAFLISRSTAIATDTTSRNRNEAPASSGRSHGLLITKGGVSCTPQVHPGVGKRSSGIQSSMGLISAQWSGCRERDRRLVTEHQEEGGEFGASSADDDGESEAVSANERDSEAASAKDRDSEAVSAKERDSEAVSAKEKDSEAGSAKERYSEAVSSYERESEAGYVCEEGSEAGYMTAGEGDGSPSGQYCSASSEIRPSKQQGGALLVERSPQEEGTSKENDLPDGSVTSSNSKQVGGVVTSETPESLLLQA